MIPALAARAVYSFARAQPQGARKGIVRSGRVAGNALDPPVVHECQTAVGIQHKSALRGLDAPPIEERASQSSLDAARVACASLNPPLPLRQRTAIVKS